MRPIMLDLRVNAPDIATQLNQQQFIFKDPDCTTKGQQMEIAVKILRAYGILTDYDCKRVTKRIEKELVNLVFEYELQNPTTTELK